MMRGVIEVERSPGIWENLMPFVGVHPQQALRDVQQKTRKRARIVAQGGRIYTGMA